MTAYPRIDRGSYGEGDDPNDLYSQIGPGETVGETMKRLGMEPVTGITVVNIPLSERIKARVKKFPGTVRNSLG